MHLLDHVGEGRLGGGSLHLDLDVRVLLLPIAESNVTAIGGLDRHHGLAVEVFHGLDFAVRVHNEVQEVVVVRLGDQVVLLTSRRAEEGAADQIVLAFLEANKCILVFKSRVLELDVLVLIVDFLQNFVFKACGATVFFGVCIRFVRHDQCDFQCFFTAISGLRGTAGGQTGQSAQRDDGRKSFYRRLFQ